MIIRHNFGYAWRHKIYYDTATKRGTLTLWSSYSGSSSEAEAAENGTDLISELIGQHEGLRDILFGVNRYSEFRLGDEEDLLHLLAGIIAVKMGEPYAFMSGEGRKIAFSLEELGKSENVIINVQIQYGKDGHLSLGEAGALAAIAKEILISIGYSKAEIAEGIGNINDP